MILCVQQGKILDPYISHQKRSFIFILPLGEISYANYIF